MSYAPNLKVDGTLAADAASLREALRWTGDTALPEGGLGRFALKARAAVNDGNARAVERQCRIRRQCRGRRDHLLDDGVAAPAGHARRRDARPHALCFDGPPRRREHPQLGLDPDRARLVQRMGSRSAPLRRRGAPRPCAARPYRRRRHHAVGTAGADGRRIAIVRRRDHRQRRRSARPSTAPSSRRRCRRPTSISTRR